MSTRPTILLLITKSDVGGAQVHVLEILQHLQHRYHFILAAGEDDYLTVQARHLGIEVRLLQHLKRPINIQQDRLAYLECVALLKEVQPNLLHTHSSKAGVIGRLAAWHLGVKSLFTAHGWAFTEGAPRIQRMYGLLLESLLCRLVGSVVTISEYDQRLAQRYHVGSAKRRYLVRNGVSKPQGAGKDQADSLTDRHPAPLKILTIGRLSPVKNHLMLVEALAGLAMPFEATIIGEGECHDRVASRISVLGLNDKVQMPGEVTDLYKYLCAADIFVLSSNYEGLPLSVLEAMSMGLPVVSTDVGGVSEAVLAGQTGLLSPRGDAQALRMNIEKLAEDAPLRARFSDQARVHYRENFTAKRMVDELDAVYVKCL